MPSSFFSILHQAQSAKPPGSCFCILGVLTANRRDRHEWRLLRTFAELDLKCQAMSNEIALQVAYWISVTVNRHVFCTRTVDMPLTDVDQVSLGGGGFWVQVDAPLLHVLCDLRTALVVKSAFRHALYSEGPQFLYLRGLCICIGCKQKFNWTARASVLKVVINLFTNSCERE